jgi:hypothetical protein
MGQDEFVTWASCNRTTLYLYIRMHRSCSIAALYRVIQDLCTLAELETY